MPELPEHLTTAALEAGLATVRDAPTDTGTLELIVRRPASDEREVLAEGELTAAEGLVGDTWLQRGSRHTEDGSAEPPRQLTLMSSRAAALIAGDRTHWPLAGDQLYVDLDVSTANLPAGTQLRIGDEVLLEITDVPHTGCAKFAARFGKDALRFANVGEGKELRLRGIYAQVVEPGTVRVGDPISKLSG